jgi:hypothetical protein
LGKDEKDEGRDGATIFDDYPTLHTYSVVVEYRYPISSLIFFVPTQLSILIQWSSKIVAPSPPSKKMREGMG